MSDVGYITENRKAVYDSVQKIIDILNEHKHTDKPLVLFNVFINTVHAYAEMSGHPPLNMFCKFVEEMESHL